MLTEDINDITARIANSMKIIRNIPTGNII